MGTRNDSDFDFEEYVTSAAKDAVSGIIQRDVLFTQKSLTEKALKDYGKIVTARWGWSIPLSFATTVFISLCSASSYGERFNIKSETLEGILITVLIFFILVTLIVGVIAWKNRKRTAGEFVNSLDVRTKAGVRSGETINDF